MGKQRIRLKNVNVHNLKSVDLELGTNELIVFTGVSGSGKSSLAFDTLYMEGQRRYIESLSTYARRQMAEMSKPDIENAEGITPTISIEQKTAGRNPRSTVGTMTDIYDFLRVLYARIGVPHCPVSGEAVAPQSRERIIRTIQALLKGTKLILLAPYAKGKKAEFKEDFQDLLRKGFTRARVDGTFIQLNDTPALDGNVAHDVEIVIDRLQVEEKTNSRIAESVTAALAAGNGSCLTLIDGEETLYSTHAYSPTSGLSYQALEPQDFSFNSPSGMCPRCQGMGAIKEFDLNLVIDPSLSIAEDCCLIASSWTTVRYGNIYNNLARLYHFDIHTPWKKLPKEAQDLFLYGTKKKWTRMQFVHPTSGKSWSDHVRWRGVLYEAHRRYSEAKSVGYRSKMEKLMQIQTCPDCGGSRLKPYPAATQLQGVPIDRLTQGDISQMLAFFNALQLSESDQLIAGELIKEITERLSFLVEVGLHYLTLDRTAPTLSGGEAQRVRLASQIGCGLVGITYILDEPSIGLHPRDNKRLLTTLKQLRDIGNTVVVVEHDEETIIAADRVVDFGPGAGSRGGKILVNGTVEALLKHSESLTGAYLSGKKQIALPETRRLIKKREQIVVKGAQHHNLKEINVCFPLGVLTCVSGVSGSGKSSLISDTLYPALANLLHGGERPVGAHTKITGVQKIDKVIAIDQTPIGRNPRSNPATYIKVFDDIRDLFTSLPESRARGYQAGRFSFNVKEGSCSRCQGMGLVRIDMDFMEDAWVECNLCHGKRFDHETLSIFYKGKTIYDILEMEVEEALTFFQNIPSIQKKLVTLNKVGMGYIKLGQSSTTLSGGEAQRIKLAKELVRPAARHTLYIFDEPTTGLHFDDIEKLLRVFDELVKRGHTLIVIEHNMDVAKVADWIIELGPDGGDGGGTIVATGTPETVAAGATPTGHALKEALEGPTFKKGQCAPRTAAAITTINVTAAEEHNLKHLDITIPRNKLTVCTGPSGSGKSSLAFDTIYAEGQRRYAESLSPYARQFVKMMPKPKVGQVEGLSPAIAIEQKAHAGNPRSTIGTMTEVYDYLRLLFARVGIPHCPETGEEIKAISKEYVVNRILDYPNGEKIQILAPIEIKGTFEEVIARLQRRGFVRIRLNGTFYDLDSDLQAMNYDRKKKNSLMLVIDRLKVSASIQQRLFEAVANAAEMGGNQLIIVRQEEGEQLFNLSFAVESTGKSYPEVTPHTFAFNSNEGMCHDCLGLGYQYGSNLIEATDYCDLPLYSLLELFWSGGDNRAAHTTLDAFLAKEKIDPFTPLVALPSKELQLVMNGSDRIYTSKSGVSFRWVGINPMLVKAARSGRRQLREQVVPLLDEVECITCKGSRLNALARHVTINGLNISALCALPIATARRFIEAIAVDDSHILEEVKNQLLHRLRFLCEVGLTYLSLDRKAPTLSGGEAQRIRLARQLGNGLTGVLYVLDEPTIGLHPRDNERLNAALLQLKNLGNTLVMVEHDLQTIATADYILDFGPRSGIHGGHITARGTLKQLARNKNSLTGAYLSGAKQMALPPRKRLESAGSITIKGATLHNLKGIKATIPTQRLTCLTGVSGSGKSTLMEQVLLPAAKRAIPYDNRIVMGDATIDGFSAFDRVISIDQNPVGHTIRSTVGTYVELLPRMRTFFASLPLARSHGLAGKHFSYNHRAGMCTHCWGLGFKRVEMHFLPPVQVLCDECQGLRLNPVSLEVTYKGKNFGQHMESTIDEARATFADHPSIKRLLDTLIAVGLGYLKIGQEVATLSGGEAQRIKLSRELAKHSTGKTLYLLDEPTTGLHNDDIEKLMAILYRLVDKGNTIVLIEHNLDVIAAADHIIDLGPDAGDQGGSVIFSGSVEKLKQCTHSITGRYLKKIFHSMNKN